MSIVSTWNGISNFHFKSHIVYDMTVFLNSFLKTSVFLDLCLHADKLRQEFTVEVEPPPQLWEFYALWNVPCHNIPYKQLLHSRNQNAQKQAHV